MKETFEEILKANIKYINYTAHSMKVRDEDLIVDLIQEGKISLWNSYQTYDGSKNIGFMNYAGKRIRWDMIRYLQANGKTIYIPKSVLENPDKIHIVNNTRTTPIDTPINEYGGTLSDLIPESDLDLQIDTSLLKSILIASIKKTRDREILELKYGIDTYKPLTYEQIGLIYGFSRQHIFRILEKTLKQLKTNATIKHIYY